MELPQNRFGEMFEGLKSRFSRSNSYAHDSYEDEEDISDGYDEYEDVPEAHSEYSQYATPTTRQPGSYRPTLSSYGSSRNHPPLVSINDVRSQARANEGVRQPIGSRRSGFNRASVGHASDYALSGSEIETPEAPVASEEISPDETSTRRGGYNSLFDSMPTQAALQPTPKPASQVGVSKYPLGNAGHPAVSDGGVAHAHKRSVVLIAPNAYEEAENVVRALKAGDAVVLTLRNTPLQLSNSIRNFSFGVASALDGKVDSIAEKVYAITLDYPLTEAELDKLRSRGVL